MSDDQLSNLLSQLPEDTDNVTDYELFNISMLSKGSNRFGTYLKCTCVNNKQAVTVYIDERDFELVEPYVEKFINKEEVEIPLFLGKDTKWHLSSATIKYWNKKEALAEDKEYDINDKVEIIGLVPHGVKTLLKEQAKRNREPLGILVRRIILDHLKEYL